ncbi:hypothetical protein HMPREF1870_02189 [Bacteroidales bacterium KA00344]|nr:hypothetical protein HMPREF1870_02189 [Bacteroidales bacterium KA00344]
MATDHIDRTQAFLDSLLRLGNQLKAAENQQKFYINRMLELKKDGQTDTKEYADLDAKTKSLQQIIDKYRPIYLKRMEMVKEATAIAKRRRNKK